MKSVNATSPPLCARVRGPLAVFTDVALKVERVTVPVMTPTAARGLLESILWKPAITWHVERIKVLAPIRFTSFRRNEVKSKAAAPPAVLVRGGGDAPMYFADDDRAQRNTVALRDVDYVIEARFEMTDRAGPLDNVQKFVEMFRRRVEKGQHFAQPYLGCREFPAEVLPAHCAPEPIRDSRSLGRILWHVEYGSAGRTRVHFFEAQLVDGVLHIPSRPTSEPEVSA